MEKPGGKKEFIQAETFRPQRQPQQESPVPGGRLLSSARPLVAPREKIQRTPSREVSDPETDSLGEPEPTPVTVVGASQPKFKVEISTPGVVTSGFYIENIESRSTATVTTDAAAKPTVTVTPTTVETRLAPIEAPQPVKRETTTQRGPERTVTSKAGVVPPMEPIAMATTMTTGSSPGGGSISSVSSAIVSSTAPKPDQVDQLVKALSEIPTQKIAPFLLLICVGAFVSSAAELDPTWLVLLTSLSSFVLFGLLKV